MSIIPLTPRRLKAYKAFGRSEAGQPRVAEVFWTPGRKLLGVYLREGRQIVHSGDAETPAAGLFLAWELARELDWVDGELFAERDEG